MRFQEVLKPMGKNYDHCHTILYDLMIRRLIDENGIRTSLILVMKIDRAVIWGVRAVFSKCYHYDSHLDDNDKMPTSNFRHFVWRLYA